MKLRKYALLLLAFLPIGKTFAYRVLFRARIAAGVRIGFGAILLFEELDLRAGVRIAPFTYVNVRTMRLGIRASIGRFTQVSVHTLELGASSTLASQVSIKGDPADPRSTFTAGAESWVFEYCYINVARPVTLGRNVGVGGGTYIFTHGFWLSQLHGYPVSHGKVAIGDDVWLPWGCFILPGVEIGSGAVIGARSVVNRSVPPFALAAGSPAKVIKEKVNVEVTVPERVEILLSTTTEFCESRRLSLETIEAGDWVVILIDGVRQIGIARANRADPAAEAVDGLLRVVHEPLREVGETSGALYSTHSFQCTPRHTLNTVQSAWLGHLRSIGTRHYPLDEVSVE